MWNLSHNKQCSRVDKKNSGLRLMKTHRDLKQNSLLLGQQHSFQYSIFLMLYRNTPNTNNFHTEMKKTSCHVRLQIHCQFQSQNNYLNTHFQMPILAYTQQHQAFSPKAPIV
nr:MAG TPA: hypothetical protein [Caudoviricetes sp.]